MSSDTLRAPGRCALLTPRSLHGSSTDSCRAGGLSQLGNQGGFPVDRRARGGPRSEGEGASAAVTGKIEHASVSRGGRLRLPATLPFDGPGGCADGSLATRSTER
jgi:hypothetical protein